MNFPTFGHGGGTIYQLKNKKISSFKLITLRIHPVSSQISLSLFDLQRLTTGCWRFVVSPQNEFYGNVMFSQVSVILFMGVVMWPLPRHGTYSPCDLGPPTPPLDRVPTIPYPFLSLWWLLKPVWLASGLFACYGMYSCWYGCPKQIV